MTPYYAITSVGGLGEMLRRAPEPAQSFSIDVEVTVAWGANLVQRASAATDLRSARQATAGCVFRGAPGDVRAAYGRQGLGIRSDPRCGGQ